MHEVKAICDVCKKATTYHVSPGEPFPIVVRCIGIYDCCQSCQDAIMDFLAQRQAASPNTPKSFANLLADPMSKIIDEAQVEAEKQWARLVGGVNRIGGLSNRPTWEQLIP